MGLTIAIIVVIISLIVLIFSGDKFVDSSVNIAKRLKIPQAVIGATFVSLGTTLPEILVTIFSIKDNLNGIAVGNAVGSVVFNSALIGGILFVFAKEIKNQKSFSSIILFLSLIFLAVMSLNGVVGLFESILLLVFFIAYVSYNYFEIKKLTKKEVEIAENKTIHLKKEILIFVLSAIGIGASAYFMVEGAKTIGSILKISDTIIGLTVVALGTSLPELVTTITAIKKKQAGLGVGNIIGSNIINCTLLIGLTGVFSLGGLTITKETLLISIPTMIICSALLCGALLSKKKKTIGVIMLSLYLIYYLYLILSALNLIVI